MQAGAACVADLRAAAFVLVLRSDIADTGVQPDGVVPDANDSELGTQDGRVGDRVQVGQSVLMWLNRLSIQAWSVGVRGRRSAERSRTWPGLPGGAPWGRSWQGPRLRAAPRAGPSVHR